LKILGFANHGVKVGPNNVRYAPNSYRIFPRSEITLCTIRDRQQNQCVSLEITSIDRIHDLTVARTREVIGAPREKFDPDREGEQFCVVGLVITKPIETNVSSVI